MFTAILSCGTVLSYEARSFRPEPGDRVPCRHHGYCVVAGGEGSGGDFSPRARPRVVSELVEWLRGRSETTVHTLRRHRFTLRLVVAAEKAGIVDLDLPAGRVVVRTSTDEFSRAGRCPRDEDLSARSKASPTQLGRRRAGSAPVDDYREFARALGSTGWVT